MEIRRQKVYSRYEIGLIMYAWSMLGFLPMMLIISYMLDLHLTFDQNIIILFILGLNLLLSLVVGLLMYFKKTKLKRQVKTHYRAEFIYIVFVSVFSLLGSVVLFDYLGGNRDYIANILVFLVALLLLLLGFFGRKFFKLKYISKK